jgi:hypothetical protein
VKRKVGTIGSFEARIGDGSGIVKYKITMNKVAQLYSTKQGRVREYEAQNEYVWKSTLWSAR